MVFPYEEFAKDNQAMLSRICTYLGVDPDFKPDLQKKHNVGSFPKSRFVNSLIENRFTRDVLRPHMPKWARGLARGVKQRNLGAAPKITSEIHGRLLEIYRSDIEKLEDLARLDLSSWKAEPSS